jgi:SAM-dependent methyltransferase
MKKKKDNKTTSWESASSWYDQAVGESGHYYHEKVILPHLSRLLSLEDGSTSSFLDLACGQGILSRHLPITSSYVGVDLSSSLIDSAKEKNRLDDHTFVVSDITKPLPVKKKDFDFCTIILALQNVEHPVKAFLNAAKHLAPGGKLILVMNHPCFRIPKLSSWGIDEEEQIQYRRIDGYYQPKLIPIQMNPSLGSKSPVTPSFHYPLSAWTLWLNEAGFSIEWMEEWCSDKKSTGKHAEREDVSREEIPLFLTITALKSAT